MRSDHVIIKLPDAPSTKTLGSTCYVAEGFFAVAMQPRASIGR